MAELKHILAATDLSGLGPPCRGTGSTGRRRQRCRAGHDPHCQPGTARPRQPLSSEPERLEQDLSISCATPCAPSVSPSTSASASRRRWCGDRRPAAGIAQPRGDPAGRPAGAWRPRQQLPAPHPARHHRRAPAQFFARPHAGRQAAAAMNPTANCSCRSIFRPARCARPAPCPDHAPRADISVLHVRGARGTAALCRGR